MSSSDDLWEPIQVKKFPSKKKKRKHVPAPVKVSDSEGSFEEVQDLSFEPDDETEYINKFLNDPIDKENKIDDETLVLHLNQKSKKLVDEETINRRNAVKEEKSMVFGLHIISLTSYMTFGKYCNFKCDDDNFQLLSVTALSNANITEKSGIFLKNSKWTLKTLTSCVKSMSHFIDSTSSQLDLDNIENQIQNFNLSENAANIVLCSALRYIGLDVKLIISFCPQALKSTKTKNKNLVNDECLLYVHIEVFLESLKQFIPVTLHSVKLESSLNEVRSKHFVYSVGFFTSNKTNSISPYHGRSPCDMSDRYDPDWMDASQEKRIASETLKILYSTMSDIIEKNIYVTDSSEKNNLMLCDKADKDYIKAELYEKPVPKSLKFFKKHPLYVLERNLLKYEVIYPKNAKVYGTLPSGENVYSRDDLHVCHTRETWIKEAMVVKIGEKPAKLVKSRLSMKRKLLQSSNDPPPTSEIFGSWQVEPYDPPIAKDGIVPTNEHNNVYLYKKSMLPKGTVHIVIPGIEKIAKELGIHCVGAVVGWTFHGAGWAHPQILGHVVCEEKLQILLAAYKQRLVHKLDKEREERSQKAIENWKKFVKGLFIMRRVKNLFIETDKPPAKGGRGTKSKRPTKLGKSKQLKEEEKTLSKQIASAIDSDKVNKMLWQTQTSSNTPHFLDESSSSEEEKS